MGKKDRGAGFTIITDCFKRRNIIGGRSFGHMSLQGGVSAGVSGIISLSADLAVDHIFTGAKHRGKSKKKGASVVGTSLIVPPAIPVCSPAAKRCIHLGCLPKSSAIPGPIPCIGRLRSGKAVSHVLTSTSLAFRVVSKLALGIDKKTSVSGTSHRICRPGRACENCGTGNVTRRRDHEDDSCSGRGMLACVGGVNRRSLGIVINSSLLCRRGGANSVATHSFVDSMCKCGGLSTNTR